MWLDCEHGNALYLTLQGIIGMIKLLSKGFGYVLPSAFQSDKLEGEFGIYRHINHHVVVITNLCHSL